MFTFIVQDYVQVGTRWVVGQWVSGSADQVKAGKGQEEPGLIARSANNFVMPLYSKISTRAGTMYTYPNTPNFGGVLT